MYMQGLTIDPDAMDAHEAMRNTSLRRKASGGKPLGMFEAMKLKRSTKDEKQDLLNVEKLLAYDPGNTDHMAAVIKAALRGGFYDTVMWMGPILLKANSESAKGGDFNKYILLKDVYHEMAMSDDTPPSLKGLLMKRAVEAIEMASAMKPEDMDLSTERKNLAAKQTMYEGNYAGGGSFRDSVRDRAKQEELLRQDQDVRTVDMMQQVIAAAEREYNADPNESGKLMKLVDALVKTEDSEYENRAIELLQQWYDRTRQFRFRLNIGKIRIAQMTRMARSLKAEVQANPADATAKETYEQFEKELWTEELNEFQLWADNYPTETGYRYQAATRMFKLHRYDEAIPLLQQVRMDPKYKFDAAIALGRSFFEAGFIEEAADTLHGVIEEYQIKGDSKSKEMNYWYARALEQKGDNQAALKAYSQTAQMDFNYRDVQARIKKLRAAAKPS
jgi:thioredoxin-like negative regulator of GroEL